MMMSSLILCVCAALAAAAVPSESGRDEAARRPVSVQLDLRKMSGKPLDGYLAEVRRTGAESVQLVLCEFFAEGEERQRLLAQLKEAIAFFERAGYPVWVWTSTLGYGDDGPPDRIRRTRGFRRMAGFDGKPTCGAMCALDPQVVACLQENIRDFARAGAKTILLDDEFVQARRENLHCFCPDHLRLMSEKAGRPVTGEDVRQALCGDPNPVRTAYLDAMGESLLALAKALRAAADEVDPSVRIGLCASFNSYDAEGGDEGLLARTLAGRGNRPLFRLSGASYWINCAWGPHYPGQDLGGVLEFLRMQIAWYGKSGFAVMDENDPYPRDSKVIPAEVVELYDMLTTASGIGIRDKYVLRESPVCDLAYRRAHAANAAENARIAALFEGRTACGWSVFAPEHQLREARMPATYEGPCRFLFRCTHPRAGIFLSLAGAATAYGSDEGPFAAFGATAGLLPREKLDRGLLTDEEGAAVLERAGVRLSAAERTDGPFALRRTADGAPVAVVGWKEDFSRRPDHPLFADEGFRAALERTHRFLSGRPPVVAVRGASGVYALAAKGADGSLAVLLANVLSVPTPPFTVRINGREQTVPGLPPWSWRTLGPVPADPSPEWISAADAPAVDAAVKKTCRAPDGTSWFAASVRNRADVRRAVWRVTALGVFDVYVNGRRIGDDFLKPGYTHARKLRYRYDYDVTADLRTEAGATNDLAAEVSHGWWSDGIAGYPGVKPAFWGELEIEYADGTRQVFGTDRTAWRAGVGGPVVHAGIYDGETYDARVDAPVRGSSAWGVPEANAEFAGEVLPVAGAKVLLRRDLALRAPSLPLRLKPGVTNVVDFGQNCAAVPHFRFRARRGTVLTVLPGEVVNPTGDRAFGDDGPKGSVHRENLRAPEIGMRVDYTFRGEGTEEYHPRFTFFGYRYVALVATDEVEIEALESIPVTSIAPEMETAEIEVGDSTLNRFLKNVRWGELSNFLSVPTDCPQRDERLGWTGDAQVFAETALYNADLRAFFGKWMRDVRDCQSAAGGFAGVAPPGKLGNTPMRIGYADAGVVVPYRTWVMTGDRRILEENFEAMDRFLRHLDETRYAHDAIRGECGNYQFADWLSFERYESFDLAWGGGRNGKFELTPEIVRYWDYLGGCHWLQDARMMSEIARALGRDASPYEKSAKTAKAYLLGTFFDAEGLVRAEWRDMQTPLLFALHLGLVEGEARRRTVDWLKRNLAAHDGRLQTGFLGTAILMDTLAENGLTDLAYDLLFKRGCPGWLHAVENGATTVWERWNGWTPEKGFNTRWMNSFNHYAYGSVVAWIWKNAVGIAADPAAPGFRRILMAPKPDRRIGSVKASYRSAAGRIDSAWRYEGDDWVWEFSVPEGATALVTPPGEASSRAYGPGRHCLRQR